MNSPSGDRDRGEITRLREEVDALNSLLEESAGALYTLNEKVRITSLRYAYVSHVHCLRIDFGGHSFMQNGNETKSCLRILKKQTNLFRVLARRPRSSNCK